MQSKEEIFDWVITFEDEVLKRVREEVIKTAEYNFGDIGRQVAEKYYRQIDGEEDFDEQIKEDCDDCKEKAKKLIEIMNLLKICNENLTSEKVNSCLIDFNFNKSDLFLEIDNVLHKYMLVIKELSSIKMKPELCREVTRRLLLEAIKRIPSDDNKV